MNFINAQNCNGIRMLLLIFKGMPFYLIYYLCVLFLFISIHDRIYETRVIEKYVAFTRRRTHFLFPKHYKRWENKGEKEDESERKKDWHSLQKENTLEQCEIFHNSRAIFDKICNNLKKAHPTLFPSQVSHLTQYLSLKEFFMSQKKYLLTWHLTLLTKGTSLPAVRVKESNVSWL